jgi:predicted anti-sigma-YlaC factor YlaD
MHYDAETLADYLHGEIGPEADAAIHTHLDACADCRALYDEAASVRDWLRAAARAGEREFPATIKARVWEAVRSTAPTFLERLRAAFRPAVALPLAAALAVFAYVGVPAIHLPGSPPAGVAATTLLEEHAALASDNPLADRGLVVQASMIDDARSGALIETSDPATATGR